MKHLNTLLPLAALGLMILGSCSSNDETPDAPSGKDNAIRFTAKTIAPRADLTTNNLSSFQVYAYSALDASTFMDNVAVTKSSTNAWEYSPVRYWPDYPLNFYAFSPASWVGSNTPLETISYNNAMGSEDILYAVTLNQTQPTTMNASQVPFNFRHALAKVDVQLASADARLNIQVSNVTIVGVYTAGDFTFPSKSTTTSLPLLTSDESIGKWSNLSGEYAFAVFAPQTQDERYTLTTSYTNVRNMGDYGQYQIPQPLSWTHTGSYQEDYLQIDIVIYDAQTGDKIWPNSQTPTENLANGSAAGDGRLKYALQTDNVKSWESGFHYLYNITINAQEDMSPIYFETPTVDGFVQVNQNL